MSSSYESRLRRLEEAGGRRSGWTPQGQFIGQCEYCVEERDRWWRIFFDEDLSREEREEQLAEATFCRYCGFRWPQTVSLIEFDWMMYKAGVHDSPPDPNNYKHLPVP